MNLWVDTANLGRAESVFGLAPLERLRRSVRGLAAPEEVILSGPGAASASWAGANIEPDGSALGARLRRSLAACQGTLVVLDGANVTDPRLIRFLAGSSACAASSSEGSRRAVALSLDRTLAEAIPADAGSVGEVADALLAAGRIAPLDEHAFPAYVDKLRRSLSWWQYVVEDPSARLRIERRLFWDNYKGSTDVLTRWVYPPLVWPLVRLSTRLGIAPNVLTVISIVLAFLAVPLWMDAHWLAGFACAYGMSVLDSVDGKVARLTLTDSRIGNWLDHGLDLIHPPFWYFAWAWGLGARPGDALYAAALWLIALYVADRVVLRIAKRRLGFALHAATRLDTLARSVIARRNILMTLMAAFLLVGAGPAGVIVITVWQGLTCAWHAARTAWLGFLAPPSVREKPR